MPSQGLSVSVWRVPFTQSRACPAVCHVGDTVQTPPRGHSLLGGRMASPVQGRGDVWPLSTPGQRACACTGFVGGAEQPEDPALWLRSVGVGGSEGGRNEGYGAEGEAHGSGSVFPGPMTPWHLETQLVSPSLGAAPRNLRRDKWDPFQRVPRSPRWPLSTGESQLDSCPGVREDRTNWWPQELGSGEARGQGSWTPRRGQERGPWRHGDCPL